MVYTILLTVSLFSWNGVSVTAQQIGKFNSVQACQSVASQLNSTKVVEVPYNDNVPKPVKTVTAARCVQLNG